MSASEGQEQGEQWFLDLWIIARSQALEIDFGRAKLIQDAMNSIHDVISFEDKFAMLIENYVEYELSLLKICLLSEVRQRDVYDDFLGQRREINRTLSNLLGSCRQYLDQNSKHIEPHLNKADASFITLKRQQYDAHLSYRLMEGLRNYVQHRDLAAHRLSIGTRWVEDSGLRKSTVSVTLNLETLRSDRAMKTAVLDELEGLQFAPDVTLMMREYVASLSIIHSEVRKALIPQLETWTLIVQAAISDYRKISDSKSMLGLSVVKKKADGIIEKVIDVFHDPIDRLQRLQLFNYCPTRLASAYVSSEYVPQKKPKPNIRV